MLSYFMRELLSTVVLRVYIYLPTSEADEAAVYFYSHHHVEMARL